MDFLTVLAVGVLVIGLIGTEPQPRPVVLSTDLGADVDDQWALTHLALSPRVELRAVVTSHAPGLKPIDAVVKTEAWLDALPPAHRPPVIAGSAEPLADRMTPRRNPGIDLILRESKRATRSNRLVIFVIGSATDMASALLIDPTLAERVEVIAMGFTRWPEGGDPWNVKNDVHAWQVLLESEIPLTVGDEAVCKRDILMSSARAHRLFDQAGAPGKALIDVLEARLKKFREQVTKTTGNPDEWPIWDEVTVAHLLGMTEVKVLPRPKLRDDLTFDHTNSQGTIQWIQSVKSEALWDDLLKCIATRR